MLLRMSFSIFLILLSNILIPLPTLSEEVAAVDTSSSSHDGKQTCDSEDENNNQNFLAKDSNENPIDRDSNITKNDEVISTIVNDSSEAVLKEQETQVEATDNKEHDSCVDSHESCAYWASLQECDKNPKFMLLYCHKSCKMCSKLQAVGSHEREKVMQIIEESNTYFMTEVLENPEYAKVRKDCQNRNEQCSYWVALGECDANPNYMTMHCALACKTCLKLDVAHRCPVDPNMEDSMKSGELHAMFEDIVMNPEFAKYEPVIHSRPDEISKTVEDKYFSESSNATSKTGPWVVTLENFLSDVECDTLVQYGHELGFQRSQDIGELQFDGSFASLENDGRTSTNAWCDDNCMSNPHVLTVLNRMGQLTKTPILNQESLQLLKYEVGQFYQRHHDFTDMHIDRQQGPRILTFFLYLNDVEEGGGTKFNDLDIVIKPKKGKALIWPNIVNKDVNEKDFSTHHEAMAVEQGIKFGANVWIHLRDFQTPLKTGCS